MTNVHKIKNISFFDKNNYLQEKTKQKEEGEIERTE